MGGSIPWYQNARLVITAFRGSREGNILNLDTLRLRTVSRLVEGNEPVVLTTTTATTTTTTATTTTQGREPDSTYLLSNLM
jgi:hypothetical protein